MCPLHGCGWTRLQASWSSSHLGLGQDLWLILLRHSWGVVFFDEPLSVHLAIQEAEACRDNLQQKKSRPQHYFCRKQKVCLITSLYTHKHTRVHHFSQTNTHILCVVHTITRQNRVGHIVIAQPRWGGVSALTTWYKRRWSRPFSVNSPSLQFWSCKLRCRKPEEWKVWWLMNVWDFHKTAKCDWEGAAKSLRSIHVHHN